MSDRELLELAAKAAGMEVLGEFVSEPDGTGQFIGLVIHGLDTRWWNPLRDDGDALRLAVVLNLHVWISNPISYAGIDGPVKTSELHNGDRYAATRRAIVRAAAEIGKTLTGEN